MHLHELPSAHQNLSRDKLFHAENAQLGQPEALALQPQSFSQLIQPASVTAPIQDIFPSSNLLSENRESSLVASRNNSHTSRTDYHVPSNFSQQSFDCYAKAAESIACGASKCDEMEEDWENIKYEPGDSSLAAIESIIKPAESSKRKHSRLKSKPVKTAPISALVADAEAEVTEVATPSASVLLSGTGRTTAAVEVGKERRKLLPGTAAATIAAAAANRVTSTNGGNRSRCSERDSKLYEPEDIRKHYPKIFERLFTGVSREFAESQYRTFCREDCVMVTRSMYNPYGPNYREVHGIASIIDFVDKLNEAVPDNLFTMKESKYHRKAKGALCIVTSFTIHGHIICKVDTDDHHNVEDIDSAVMGLALLTQQSKCCTDSVAADTPATSSLNETTAKVEDKETGGVAPSNPALVTAVVPEVDTALSVDAAAAAVLMEASGVALKYPSPSTYSSAPITTAENSCISSSCSDDSAPPAEKRQKLSSTAQSSFSSKYQQQTQQQPRQQYQDAYEDADAEDDTPLLSASLKQLRDFNRNTPAMSAPPNKRFSLSGAAPLDARNRLLSSLPIRQAHSVRNTTAAAANGSSSSSGNSSGDDGAGTASVTDTARLLSSKSTSPTPATAAVKVADKKKHTVMIVAPNAKFRLAQRIDIACSEYNVRGTLTVMVDADWKVYKIDMLNAFDTSSHREKTDL